MAISLIAVLVWIICAVVLVAIFGGMLFHFLTVGSIFAIVAQRMKQHVEETSPKPCPFCGGNIPAGQTHCPGCGGPRDGTANTTKTD
jgi:hypothetical protein